MKWMKWLGRTVLVLVVLLILAGVGGYFYMDAIARHAVERGGAYATGVPTSVDAVNIKPTAGQVTLHDLTVDNPEGFEREHFLSLDQGEVAVAIGSLMKDEVVIPRLHLKGVKLDLAHNDQGKANYQIIMDNIEKVAGSPEDQPEDQQGKRYIIKELVISDIQVTTDYPLVSEVKQPITIADIRMENVGSKTKNGVLLSQVYGIVIRSVLLNASTQLTDVLPKAVVGSLQDGVRQIGSIGGMTVEDLGSLLKDAGKIGDQLGGDAGKNVGKALKGIGGLLNHKQDQEQGQQPSSTTSPDQNDTQDKQ